MSSEEDNWISASYEEHELECSHCAAALGDAFLECGKCQGFRFCSELCSDALAKEHEAVCYDARSKDPLYVNEYLEMAGAMGGGEEYEALHSILTSGAARQEHVQLAHELIARDLLLVGKGMRRPPSRKPKKKVFRKKVGGRNRGKSPRGRRSKGKSPRGKSPMGRRSRSRSKRRSPRSRSGSKGRSRSKGRSASPPRPRSGSKGRPPKGNRSRERPSKGRSRSRSRSKEAAKGKSRSRSRSKGRPPKGDRSKDRPAKGDSRSRSRSKGRSEEAPPRSEKRGSLFSSKRTFAPVINVNPRRGGGGSSFGGPQGVPQGVSPGGVPQGVSPPSDLAAREEALRRREEALRQREDALRGESPREESPREDLIPSSSRLGFDKNWW